MLYQIEPHLDGAPEGIRTPDLLVRSQTLYPAELRAHDYEITIIYINKNFNKNGGSEWNRTIDTRIFSPLLYRLSYRAKKMAVRTGIEPAIFCVTGRRVNPCTTGPWLREKDLNLRPSGYEPNELPSCSIPRYILAEEKGFEPLRRLHDLPVFKTGPFNQTWVFLRIWCLRPDLNRHEV